MIVGEFPPRTVGLRKSLSHGTRTAHVEGIIPAPLNRPR